MSKLLLIINIHYYKFRFIHQIREDRVNFRQQHHFCQFRDDPDVSLLNSSTGQYDVYKEPVPDIRESTRLNTPGGLASLFDHFLNFCQSKLIGNSLTFIFFFVTFVFTFGNFLFKTVNIRSSIFWRTFKIQKLWVRKSSFSV